MKIQLILKYTIYVCSLTTANDYLVKTSTATLLLPDNVVVSVPKTGRTSSNIITKVMNTNINQHVFFYLKKSILKRHIVV